MTIQINHLSLNVNTLTFIKSFNNFAFIYLINDVPYDDSIFLELNSIMELKINDKIYYSNFRILDFCHVREENKIVIFGEDIK